MLLLFFFNAEKRRTRLAIVRVCPIFSISAGVAQFRQSSSIGPFKNNRIESVLFSKKIKTSTDNILFLPNASR